VLSYARRLKTTVSLDKIGLEFPMLDSLKIFFSYCLAVTAATIPYVMLTMLRGISNFESATTHSVETKTKHFIEMLILTLFAAWIFVFVFAALPFSIGIAIASRRERNSWAFHVIGGTVTAMFVGPLTGYFQFGFNVTEPQPWGYPYPMLMPVFAPFGAFAGLTFWIFAKLKNTRR
jgi:hypothetical protein